MNRQELLHRLKAPAYTGPNRCWPCTAVNIGIVAVASAVAGVVVPATAVVVAVVGLTLVWLRGYVVPGTPTLTKLYVPDRVLAWFGKSSTVTPPSGPPSERLRSLGVVTDSDEPRLALSFRQAWTSTAMSLSDDAVARRAAAAEALSATAATVDVTRSDGGGVTLSVDGDWVGQWPSEVALTADLATEKILRDTAWTQFDRAERADLAARIRGLADRCPVCGTATRVADDTVESCCQSRAVVAVTCLECDARLAEFDPAAAGFGPGL